MKDRNVIKIIKQRADEKQIPNVLMLIKEKYNINDQVQEQRVIEKKPFNLKALYVSFSLVLTASVVVVLTLLSQGQNPDLFDNSAFSDQVILSAISTIELVDLDLEVNNYDSNNMLLALEDEDDYVENQLDEVLKYTEFMETFLNNTDQYKKEIENVSYLGYKKLLTYEFMDMMDELNVYEFYYHQEIDKKTNVYQIKGLLISDDNTYELTIDGIVDQDEFSVSYQIDENQEIKVSYQKNNLEHLLTIKKYNQAEVIKESQITFNNKESATLTFIKGEAKGIYRFQMDQSLPNGKTMRINYKIDDIDEGEIDLTVQSDTNHNYVINIRPDNRPESVVEKERPTQPGNGQRPDQNRKK